MLTGSFWAAALERAIKTFAQTLVAIVSAGGAGLLSVPWLDALSVAGLATVVSVLTSIASASATGNGPSLTNAEAVTHAPKHLAEE